MLSKVEAITPPLANKGTVMKWQANWRDYVVYLFFAVILVIFGFTIGDKGFLTVANLFNITRTTSMIAIMAIAMTLVIAAGELDLSIGSAAALSALVAALVIKSGYGIVAGALAGLISGLAVGALNGFFCYRSEYPVLSGNTGFDAIDPRPGYAAYIYKARCDCG